MEKILTEIEIVAHPILENEPFGRVILESLAAGKTVISADRGAICEILKNGKNGFLVRNLTAENLAKKILEIANDENLREKFFENGKKTAAKFSREKVFAPVCEFLEN